MLKSIVCLHHPYIESLLTLCDYSTIRVSMMNKNLICINIVGDSRAGIYPEGRKVGGGVR